MQIYTIGFTKKSAAEFFGILKGHGIRRLVDVRLNNVSQLAGFTKRDDLAFFLNAICGADYLHEQLLAPTQEMLDAYKKAKGAWADYEKRFSRFDGGAQNRGKDRSLPVCCAHGAVVQRGSGGALSSSAYR
jgi:hypothetical protein